MPDVWKVVRELPDHRLVSMAMPEGLWRTYRDEKGKLRQVESAFAFDTPERAQAFTEKNQACAQGDLRIWQCTAETATPVGVVLGTYSGDILGEVFSAYAKQVGDVVQEVVTVNLHTIKAQEGTLLCRDLRLVKELDRGQS